jgi:putative transposase
LVEAFLAVAATCAGKTSMSFYAPQTRQQQAESLLAAFLQTDGLPLEEVLTPEDVVTAFAGAGADCHGSATAIFTPLMTLWAFLGQLLHIDRSCRAAVLRIGVLCAALARPLPATDTAAYCRARARLPTAALRRLTTQLGQRLESRAPKGWLWQGHSVKLADGSTSAIPDTPANQEAFPPRRSRRGISYPLIRWVCLVSLATAAVLDFNYGPYQGKQTSELTLFRSMQCNLHSGDVLLADRFFCTWFTFALAQRQGANVVARLHASRTQDFRVGVRYGQGERLMFWKRPARPEWLDEATYQSLPRCLTVREILVHVERRGCRSRRLIVATTLLERRRYSRDAVAELYSQRWQVELDIRALKANLGLGELRCQSPEMLAKEIWGGLLAYNLVRKLGCQVASLRGLRPRQISFTACRQALCAGLKQRVLAEPTERVRVGAALLARLGQEQVGNRPGRVEPRAVKRSGKGYPRLGQPRAQARARLLR